MSRAARELGSLLCMALLAAPVSAPASPRARKPSESIPRSLEWTAHLDSLGLGRDRPTLHASPAAQGKILPEKTAERRRQLLKALLARGEMGLYEIQLRIGAEHGEVLPKEIAHHLLDRVYQGLESLRYELLRLAIRKEYGAQLKTVKLLASDKLERTWQSIGRLIEFSNALELEDPTPAEIEQLQRRTVELEAQLGAYKPAPKPMHD